MCDRDKSCIAVQREEKLAQTFADHAKWAIVLLLALVYVLTTPLWSESFDMAKEWQPYVGFTALIIGLCTLETFLAVRTIRKAP